jgi:hypothetical protein
MVKLLIHSKVLGDLEEKRYTTLDQEMSRVCRLLIQDGKMPGEGPVHYVKLLSLQNKTFHAGINLPKENVSKRKGARIIYVKEDLTLIKIIYVGGHKDKKYDNSNFQVKMIEERYLEEGYIEYKEGLF